jgi:hypothetical protein
MLPTPGMSASAPQTASDPALVRGGHVAAAAMWDRIIGNVPTLLGKLVSAASFRVGASPEYRHPNLDRVLSPEISSRVLRESHEHLFAEWVGLFLDEQSEDLQRYLTSLPRESAAELLHRASESLVPASANPVARRAFLNDLEQILGIEKPSAASRLEPSDALAAVV